YRRRLAGWLDNCRRDGGGTVPGEAGISSMYRNLYLYRRRLAGWLDNCRRDGGGTAPGEAGISSHFRRRGFTC
ncbi:MAG: hypothetical protein JXD22_07210, partial [Sedimentisphaerales bacterium]|nr:hypothetical protein [Sedimentisphaerales bacterium]